MKARKYLLAREWSMGNGQCPDCCGVPPSWHGHPLHLTTDTIGHKLDCDLAASIKDIGGKPLYIGEFKSSVEYEDCLVPAGPMNPGMNFMSTQIKGSNPENRRLWQEWGDRMQKRFKADLFGSLTSPQPTEQSTD